MYSRGLQTDRVSAATAISTPLTIVFEHVHDTAGHVHDKKLNIPQKVKMRQITWKLLGIIFEVVETNAN